MDFNSIDLYDGVEELWKEEKKDWRKMFKRMFINNYINNKVPNFCLINKLNDNCRPFQKFTRKFI